MSLSRAVLLTALLGLTSGFGSILKPLNDHKQNPSLNTAAVVPAPQQQASTFSADPAAVRHDALASLVPNLVSAAARICSSGHQTAGGSTLTPTLHDTSLNEAADVVHDMTAGVPWPRFSVDAEAPSSGRLVGTLDDTPWLRSGLTTNCENLKCFGVDISV